ncbi:MAG TPA: PDZ domain-containing protein [Luteolibacter sp.]|nr:PDZ domain-containing protein [Luteolibacter sp.]
MKTTFSTIALASAMLLSRAAAIEAPADDTPPPSIPMPDAAGVVEAQRPYIGIVSNALPELLAKHLQLETGVLVDSVMPEGPAAKAGILANDIITHLNGKAMDTPADLSQTVADLEPGGKVRVNLIHEGREKQVEVTLGSRAERMARNAEALDQLNLQGVPDHMAKRMRGMIERNLGEFDMAQDDLEAWLQGSPLAKRLQEMRRMMEQDLPQADAAPQGERPGEIRFEQNSTIRMLDGDGSIEIQSRNGQQQLSVRDRNDKVVWEGPWTTEADKAAAPEDIRKRVEGLNIETFNGNGLRLRMGR